MTVEAMGAMGEAIFDLDKDASIVPIDEDSTFPTLEKQDTIPSDINDLRHYFKLLNPNCLKPWTVPEDKERREKGPPNINLTVRIGSDFDMEAVASRVKVKIKEIIQTKKLKATFSYKLIQEVVTTANTVATGVHADLDPRGTCEEFQGVIDGVHQSLRDKGDEQAR